MVVAGLALIALTIAAVAAWQRIPFDGSANTTHTPSSDNKSWDKQAPTLSADKSVAPPVSGKSVAAPVQAQSAIHQPPGTTGASLPPAGTPWHQVFAALMGRAQAGDKAASDRLYNDTFGCIQYSLALPVARDRLDTESDMGELNAAQIARELEGYTSLQSILRENAATCSNVARDELFKQMYSILFAAARNGNERAAACYAAGAYAPPGGDGESNEAALATWAGNALNFMHAGVQGGDWKMVLLLRTYFDPLTRRLASNYDSKWQAYQFRPDPLLAYRYAALWAVGANIDGSEKDQTRASSMLSEYRQRFAFSDAQVRDTTEWAQRTYQQYFAGVPGWDGKLSLHAFTAAKSVLELGRACSNTRAPCRTRSFTAAAG